MNNSINLSKQAFVDCNLNRIKPENDYCNLSLMRNLDIEANEMEKAGKIDCSTALRFLSKIASMSLAPTSINIPYRPMYENHLNGTKTFDLENLNQIELLFIAEILDDVDNSYLKARLADLLWLLNKPRNPIQAKIAIDNYALPEINKDTWLKGVNDGVERAIRLCIQIRDSERLDGIIIKLYSALSQDNPDYKFLNLWIANLLDKLNIDHEIRGEIAARLKDIANSLKENNDFNSASSYYKLAAKKFQQHSNISEQIECLILVAECAEFEADNRANNNLVANSFYEEALQEYRKIPKSHREAYGVENRILQVRSKITSTGQAAVEEMAIFQTDSIDISEIVLSATNYVTGKQNAFTAILFFVGLASEPNYEQILKSAKESVSQSFFASLFGGRHLSNDGRLIAKTPPLDMKAFTEDTLTDNSLRHQIQMQFSIQMEFDVKGAILPALHQLCLEHRFTKDLFISICKESLLVPDDRVYLTANALWLGFEREFGLALHLLCPQLEHFVRLKLKDAGAHTSTIGSDGIETENGLSTIMDLPEADSVFGKNLSFEIKSLFTDSLGFNLRNQIAHGLLDDINASHSVASIYAWWMMLRMVIKSIPIR